MNASDFLDIVQGNQKNAPSFRIGTISASYSGGRPRIRFEGETVESSRRYPYLLSYTPTASDRVLVAMVGHGGVVLGKIV